MRATFPSIGSRHWPPVPIPTLGGKQFWRDTFLRAGWRIQENSLSGTSRLLDPRNRQWAAGGFDTCHGRFEGLRTQHCIAPNGDHLVLMIHGIARSTGTFRNLQRELQVSGYDTASISYPSTRTTIETHAEGLAVLLDRLEGTKTVSFVTHSMGALILRQLLAENRAWQREREVGRIVLIAPPNQGAAMAQRLKNCRLYKSLYGPAGQQLVPNAAQRIPGINGYDFAIVAGGRGAERGFNPLLSGDDDGTVTVAETALEGARETCTVRHIHANITNQPDTIRAATRFIKGGNLVEDSH